LTQDLTCPCRICPLPTHIYTTTGIFTVTLTATGSGESDVRTKPNYITVSSGDLGDLVTTTITYDYDPLYRLTEAAYSSGEVHTYTYDARQLEVARQPAGDGRQWRCDHL